MVHKTNKLISSQKIRFAVVGGINTLTDFTVLFALAVLAGVPVLAANIASTSTALVVSYSLNKRAVFRDEGRTQLSRLFLFVGVTLFGLWVIQGGVIWVVSTALAAAPIQDSIILFISKLAATIFSLVWNYIWYSRVIFSKQNTKDQ